MSKKNPQSAVGKRKPTKYPVKMIFEMTSPEKNKAIKIKATMVTPFQISKMEGTMKTKSVRHTKEFKDAVIKLTKQR